jgi:hypothetical protein
MEIFDVKRGELWFYETNAQSVSLRKRVYIAKNITILYDELIRAACQGYVNYLALYLAAIGCVITSDEVEAAIEALVANAKNKAEVPSKEISQMKAADLCKKVLPFQKVGSGFVGSLRAKMPIWQFNADRLQGFRKNYGTYRERIVGKSKNFSVEIISKIYSRTLKETSEMIEESSFDSRCKLLPQAIPGMSDGKAAQELKSYEINYSSKDFELLITKENLPKIFTGFFYWKKEVKIMKSI